MRVFDMVNSYKGRTTNAFKLWDKVLASYLNKDSSGKGITKNANLYMDLKGLYSGDSNISFVYAIDNLPPELEVDFHSSIRRECKEGVRVSFVTDLERHKIEWSSPQMKSRLRTWKTLDEDSDTDVFNLHSNLYHLDSNARRKDSLVYLTDAEMRRKRSLFKVRQLMIVSGKRGEDFDDSIKEITRECRNKAIKVTRVMLNIQDYLSYFSPFSSKYVRDVVKNVGSNVLTDELISRFNTCSQGKIGKNGHYWGTDIFSKYPCLKPTKVTSETAENWLIIGETGSGKSFFLRVLLFQLLANKRYIGTVMDIEGHEYLPIAHYLMADRDDIEILNMAEGQGYYYDPVEIVTTGNSELDKDMFDLSKSFTISLFKTLVKSDSEENEISLDMVEEAVSSAYEKMGVDSEKYETWEKSRNSSVVDVYNAFVDLEIDLTEPKEVSAKKQALRKLKRYFTTGGSRSSLFRKKVSLSRIVNSKLLVCSFGMAAKSPHTIDKTQMALMQLSTAMISYIRSIFAFNSGLYNFKVWEEFQRWGNFPDSEKTISTALTGGRKLGDINIIVSNKASDMLNNDKFGVFENHTSFAIGAIGDESVRREIARRLSIEELNGDLDKLISENKDYSSYVEGDNISENPYKHAFLIGLDRTMYTISKMTIPEKLAKSDLFRTGVKDMAK